MSQISLSIPQVGLPDTTEDVKVANNFTTIQNVINGGLDGTNLSAAGAQSAAVNQSGQTVKGSFIKLGTDTTTSTTFGTLSTPDQVAGITLGSAGLLFVYYRAQWVCTAGGGAGAAEICLNGTAVQVDAGNGTFVASLATTNASGGFANGLSSTSTGLVNAGGANLTVNDPTTGLYIAAGVGGPAVITAAAGTYTVSIQFKTSSGTLSVSNRRLYVKAESFA